MVDPAKTAPEPTLLFIPDISGFTSFVRSTEINHARHIVEELLNKLIDANQLGLKVVEVEGDAILFARPGPPPPPADFFGQVRRMFVAFHAHLQLYESRRICHCGACRAAHDLQLKFIAHHGPVAQANIGGHAKLFGEDVIVAHRLLKNSVDRSDYVLVSDAVRQAWSEPPPWVRLQNGSDQYDCGEIRYAFAPLDTLKAEIPPPAPIEFAAPETMRPLTSCEREVRAPMELLFDVASDLPSRVKWVNGVRQVVLLNDKLNRIGTRHRCLAEEKIPLLVTGPAEQGVDLLAFSEGDDRQMGRMVYLFKRVAPDRTIARMEFFIRDSLPVRLLFGMMKGRMGRNFETSLGNLARYCEEQHRAASA